MGRRSAVFGLYEIMDIPCPGTTEDVSKRARFVRNEDKNRSERPISTGKRICTFEKRPGNCLKLEKTLLLRGEPSLKNQYVPEVIMPIAPARQMFFPFLPYERRPEEPLIAESFGIEQLPGPVPQWPAQPGVDWNAKAHF